MNGDTMQPIRLGVIGTGLAVEQLHWPALRQLRDRFPIVAFANHTRPKAEHFASYSGASMEDYSTDYHELLRRTDVDAVLISLPIPLNYAVTRAALEAGKDVICEKPAGVDEAEGRRFVALEAEFPDRVILIAENMFYRDDLRQARALLDAGAIGRVHLASWRLVSRLVPVSGTFSSTPWRHDPGYRGGPHLDGGVHHTAQLRLLCGDVQRVYGETQDANATHGGPSDLTLSLRFVSGMVGSYTASYPEIAPPTETNELRLYGDAGTMTLGNRTVTVYRTDGAVEEHRMEEGDNGYYNEFLNFYEAVRYGEPVLATITQTFHNMLIMLRGLDAAERGEVLTLDDAPGGIQAVAVPLWKPRGATGLFDGLPMKMVSGTKRG